MPARLALLVVSLVAAATASASPLTGAWKSDGALRLLETGKDATITLGQGDVLSTLDLFGRLVAIHAEREIEFQPAEGGVNSSYRIVATGSDFVDVAYGDGRPGEPVRMRLLLHEGPLPAPVENLVFYEAFRRVDAPATLAP